MSLIKERYAGAILGEEKKRLLGEAGEKLNLCHELAQGIISIYDDGYPKGLQQICDPPLVLFTKGNINLLKREPSNMISIVGTRSPSPLSTYWVAAISRFLSGCGLTTVSGMAAGIDGGVHANSIASPSGTIGVLAHSIELSGPLVRRLCEGPNALVVSEYPPGMRAQIFNFPRRNRLIAGLSQGSLFVEGGVDSGALYTMEHAGKYGRCVYYLKRREQKNNAGAEVVRLDHGGVDITNMFPILVVRDEERSRESNLLLKKGFTYLGSNQWALCRLSGFSSRFPSPAQRAPGFEQ